MTAKVPNAADAEAHQLAMEAAARYDHEHETIEVEDHEIDHGAAQRFLATLDHNAQQFAFRTIEPKVVADTSPGALPTAPRKKNQKPRVANYYGTYDEIKGLLEEDNANGRGIYVVVNEVRPGGTKDEDVTRFRAVFADMDDKPGVNVIPAWPLKPTIEVASGGGNGRHFYWRINGAITEGEWSRIIGGIHAYGADPSCKNPSRVLRLPGYFHTKGPRVRSEMVRGTLKAYSAEELLKAFASRPVQQSKPTPNTKALARALGLEKAASVGDLAAALAVIPVTVQSKVSGAGYTHWLKIGAALHHETSGSSAGLKLWHDWCALEPDHYNADEVCAHRVMATTCSDP